LKVQVIESLFTYDLVCTLRLVQPLSQFARDCTSGKILWSKIKGLAVGTAVGEGDDSPLVVEGGEMGMVRDFTYLVVRSLHTNNFGCVQQWQNHITT